MVCRVFFVVFEHRFHRIFLIELKNEINICRSADSKKNFAIKPKDTKQAFSMYRSKYASGPETLFVGSTKKVKKSPDLTFARVQIHLRKAKIGIILKRNPLEEKKQ